MMELNWWTYLLGCVLTGVLVDVHIHIARVRPLRRDRDKWRREAEKATAMAEWLAERIHDMVRDGVEPGECPKECTGCCDMVGCTQGIVRAAADAVKEATDEPT